MELTTLKISSERNSDAAASVPVFVSEQGQFSAEFLGETFEADNLGTLQRQLRDAMLAARFEVPFVSVSGRRGVIRGYHAGNRDLLVTWEDGEKDKLSPYVSVFKTLDDSMVLEIKSLLDQVAQITSRLKELQSAGTVAASDLFAEAFGEDITSWERQRNLAASV